MIYLSCRSPLASAAASATEVTHTENSVTQVSNAVARAHAAIAKSKSTPFQVPTTATHPITPGGTIDLITPVGTPPNKTNSFPSPMRQLQFSAKPPHQRVSTPITDRLNNRAAGKCISCGVTKDQVPTTSKRQLFDHLLGTWDPVLKKYPNQIHIMNLMEAAIGLGGGPVHGVNFTARCRSMAMEMKSNLGGKPSEDIMFATVLALYRIKSHVDKQIREADPMTGVTGFAVHDCVCTHTHTHTHTPQSCA